MSRSHQDTNGGKGTETGRTASKEQLEMAQRIAREMLRDDHHAFQVSIRNSRD